MRLRLNNLKKSYGSETVLDIERAEISGGLITGIIGPNGAGKTTLMNIIAGLDEPDCGEVLYEQPENECRETSSGSDFTPQLPTQAVTMLFQTPYMLHTSVEKNVAYPLKLRSVEKEVIQRRVANLLEELDLVPLAKNKAWRLSGGETQKVALARALALRPQLLLLDEPTSNIDNLHVAVIEKVLIGERDKHQTTQLFISHNLAQIKRICDEVIFMDKGKIVEQGNAEQLLQNPQDPRTQAFVAGELLL